MLTGGFSFRLNARFLTRSFSDRICLVRVTTLLEEACTMYKHLVRVLVTIQGLLFFIPIAYAQSTILDLPRAAKIAGARFALYRGLGLGGLTSHRHCTAPAVGGHARSSLDADDNAPDL